MTNNITKVLTWTNQDSQLILNFEKGKSSISITENNLVRFRYTNKQDFSNEENYVLNNSLKLNDYSLSENGRRLVMSTDFLKVITDLDTFQLTIFDENNKEVISGDNDFLSTEDKTTTVRLKLAKGEKIYGLGQDPMANLNQRDKERRVWHQYGHIRRSGNIGVPFMISSKNSIFRVHGARPGNEIWSFGEQTEEICRYFVKMRYQLLPYIYSMAYNLRENGAPMMRAMSMDSLKAMTWRNAVGLQMPAVLFQ